MKELRSTKQYRLTADSDSKGHYYNVELRGRHLWRGLYVWRTIKIFRSDDDEYAYNCAVELYETLIDDIEPKPVKSPC